MPSTIFVIDSSPAVRRMVEQISAPAGYDVIGFQDGPAALEAARRMSPALIITDYHLDNMTFSGFCKEVHKLDNLSDTYIIALTGASDKLEETHLKSLGVKAFLKKPFQSENLLDLIKDLDRQGTPQAAGGKKKRSWPPTSSATDSDDDPGDDAGSPDEEPEVTFPFPVQANAQKDAPITLQRLTAAPATPPAAEPEEAMKGLFGQLLQSMSGKTEKKIAEMLPEMVGRKLEAHVTKAVEAEVRLQLGAAISQERLTEVVEPMLTQALPRVLTSEMAVLEPIIRHSIFEIASPLIEQQVERMVRDQADAAKELLPEAIRKHLRSMEEELREQIKQCAAAEIERSGPEILRAVAQEQVQTTVQKLIPSMVEDAIKAEIRRLTEST